MVSKYLCPWFLLYQRAAQFELLSFCAGRRAVEERSAGAQGHMGGLYVLRVLLNLGVWRNGQEKIKCERSLETN